MIHKLYVYIQNDRSFTFEFYSVIDVDILSMIDLCKLNGLGYKEYFSYTSNLRSVSYYHLCINVLSIGDWVKLKEMIDILDVYINANRYDELIKENVQ